MFRKALLLLAALVFAVGAQLRPCWKCEIDGTALPYGCGLRSCLLAERTAEAAAEEILPGHAALPDFQKRLCLRLRRPEGSAALLTDALLRATDGVVIRDEVRVGGERLGFVADGGKLREALRRHIANTLPVWASGGVLSRELAIRRLYTRDGYLTPEKDMLLLVTGAAPVFYYDETGRYARA